MCRVCKQGWQNGGGREIAIPAADLECAACDAQLISIDEPGRATRSVPAATRTLVFRRDHNRCTVPGCRSAQNLDVHHIVHREHGGSHEAANLTVLCDGHHRAHHEGTLAITGRAPDIEVTWLCEVPHVGEADAAVRDVPVPEPDAYRAESAGSSIPHVGDSHLPALARSALRNLGFTRDEARIAVERAVARTGVAELEPLLRAALRECPKPGSA